MSAQNIPVAKFRLGRIVATPQALEVLTNEDILKAIIRHQAGNWGDMKEEDAQANDHAVVHGKRVLSSYRSAKGVTFWLITEADRSSTTVLLPEEY
ncbi:MAG: hypothetical protein JWR19_4103 [Pedosphaera sp.]|nr:hypothetical protein [Pedosphaera sp.]